MKNEDKYINQIAAYLGKMMSPEEKRLFEDALNQDKELADAFQNYQFMQATVEQHLEKELSQRLDSWEEAEKKRPKLRRLRIILVAAAGILLLISIPLLIKWFSPVLPVDQLALEYYIPPAPPENQMGTEEPGWVAAAEAYESGDFSTAIDSLLALNDRNPEMDYYLAHSYFQLEEYNASIPIFRELATGSSIYNRRAEWYQLLSLLASGQDNDLAKQLLTQISQDKNHPFYKKARQVARKNK